MEALHQHLVSRHLVVELAARLHRLRAIMVRGERYKEPKLLMAA
jgi:hypothetical protein